MQMRYKSINNYLFLIFLTIDIIFLITIFVFIIVFDLNFIRFYNLINEISNLILNFYLILLYFIC